MEVNISDNLNTQQKSNKHIYIFITLIFTIVIVIGLILFLFINLPSEKLSNDKITLEDLIPDNEIGINIKHNGDFNLITDTTEFQNLNLPYKIVSGFHKEYRVLGSSSDYNAEVLKFSESNLDIDLITKMFLPEIKNNSKYIKKEIKIKSQEVYVYYVENDPYYDSLFIYSWTYRDYAFIIIDSSNGYGGSSIYGQEIANNIIGKYL